MVFTVQVDFTLITLQTGKEMLFCQDVSNYPSPLRNWGEEKERFSKRTCVIVFAILVQLWKYKVQFGAIFLVV